MTQMKLKEPCKECPWKKDSFPGWLGASTPEAFVAAQQVYDMPCHMTVNYKDPEWESKLDKAITCLGGLQFLKNSFTMPRERWLADRVRSVTENPNVFQWAKDFIAHHRKYGHGSWDYK